MKIRLYKSSAPKNKVNKINDLTLYRELEGNFRAPASITNPSMTIEFQQVDEPPAGPWDIDINYAYIPDFNRYYFISGMTLLSYNKIELSLAVDVLYSFKNSILANKALIARNENEYNLLIPDERRTQTTELDVYNVIPTSGRLVNTEFFTSDDLTFNIFVSTINMENKSPDVYLSSYTNVEPPSGTDLPEIYTGVFQNTAGMEYGIIRNGRDLNILMIFISLMEVSSFCKSVIAYPFNIGGLAVLPYRPVLLGEKRVEDLSQTSGAYLNALVPYHGAQSDYLVIADFVMPNFTDFEQYEPYTFIDFWIPFYGYTRMNIGEITNKHIIVYYIGDYSTGDFTANVYDVDSHRIIWSSAVKLGYEMSITATNYFEVQRKQDSLNMNLILSLFAGGIGLARNVANNPSSANAIGEGAMSGVRLAGDLGNWGIATAGNIPTAQATTAGNLSNLAQPLYFFYKVTKQKPVGKTADYNKVNGLPLRTTKLLSSLSGYTEVSAINLTGLDTALSSEQDEIVSLLKSGVIF